MGEHMLQYAFVGGRHFVGHTTDLTDEEIKARFPFAPGAVQRFNRCPACEAWTTTCGRLRTELECPAVKSALSV